nr:hypothetical protein [Collimonas sp. OK607]
MSVSLGWSDTGLPIGMMFTARVGVTVCCSSLQDN